MTLCGIHAVCYCTGVNHIRKGCMSGCNKDHNNKLPCGCATSDSIGMIIKYMHENRKTC